MCLQEFALRSFEKCPSVSWISEAIMMWVQNIFVCLCLYDDLLYFVSHGLAITPGNWIIYTKKMTIILTKDSGTRENVFYICMGDYELLRFKKNVFSQL